MKTQSTLRAPKTLSFALFATLMAMVLLFMVSCSKNDNQAQSPAFLLAANTAQGSAAQDFYVDGNKLNATALAYSQSTSYFQLTPGTTHQGQFKASSTNTIDASASLQLSPGAFYSVYFSDNNNASVYQNDPTTPQNNDARVRFINLSSGLTSNIDITSTVATKSTTVVSALAAKSASTYYETTTLSPAFALNISGSNTVLLNIPVVLQAGKIYSVIISGASTTTLTYSLVIEN